VRNKSCEELEEVDEVAAPFVQEERWSAMVFLDVEDRQPLSILFAH
jgi:hypothetical protein